MDEIQQEITPIIIDDTLIPTAIQIVEITPEGEIFKLQKIEPQLPTIEVPNNNNHIEV